MAERYDTAMIREAAKQVKHLALLLEDEATRNLADTLTCLDDWQGSAAEACEEHIHADMDAIRGAAGRLNDVESGLKRLADALEEVDRRLAQDMGGER